ncbi:MAG: poly-beta-1,6-N-acetyl-D-glucosamine biosynthesis protein PgaD [Burkholderiaceae bacterium]|jgi:biofilm PGA synthesis protein PgaD
MKDLIIDQPQWQTAKQRVVFGSMTALFWALWIYLWLPVLAFIGWVLGFKIAYDQMIVRNGYVGLLNLLGLYSLIICCLGASLLFWAYYNYFRFRGVERRKARPGVTLLELSERYKIPPEELGHWKTARRLVVHHSAEGHITHADH